MESYGGIAISYVEVPMRKRKFRFLLILCFMICCILIIVNIKIQKSEEKLCGNQSIVFRLAETGDPHHPSAMASGFFSSLVDERSNGRIKIKVYYNEDLGTPKEILEQVQFGGIAMARVNVLELTEVVNSLQYYFKPEAYKDSDALIDWISENSETISDSCQMECLYPLVWYYPDIRCFYSDETKLHKVSNFKNMKIKTTGCTIMTEVMQALGGTAVETVTADTYKSFSTGYLDAGETTLTEFMLSDFYRFMNYITLSHYIACPDVMVVSTDVFTMLAKPDRELLIECAKDTYEYQKELLKESQDENITKLTNDKLLFFADDKFDLDMKENFIQDKAVIRHD